MNCWTAVFASQVSLMRGITREDLGPLMPVRMRGMRLRHAILWRRSLVEVQRGGERILLLLKFVGGARFKLGVAPLAQSPESVLLVLNEGSILSVSYGNRRYLLENDNGCLRLSVGV